MSIERIVVEMTMVVDDIGTEQTQYFATSGFTTKPTDTPANTYVAPRLKSAGSFKRELFSGSRVTGSVRPSFGEIVLFNGDGGLDSWMGYGVSGGKVVVRIGPEDGAYPAAYTTIYIAYAQYIRADFSEIKVILRDRLHLLDQPLVTAQFEGTGGLEGATAMAGKLKQWVSSDPGYFPPILVDYALQLYFVQSTSPGWLMSAFKVFEGALEIARSTNYPDAATCLSSSPAAGQARFWFGAMNAGPVYFRLGSVPQYDLRVAGYGASPAGGAWTIPVFADFAGISGGSGAGTVSAQLVDDDRTYLDVLESACTAFSGYFGMTRLDAFVSGVLSVPGATPVYTFTHRNAKSWSRSPVQDMDAPVWTLTVNAGKTWPSNLVGAATAVMKDYLSRDPWWASFSRQDAAIKTANPGAVAASVETSARVFQSALDQTIFTSAYMALFGVRRDFYTCTVPLTPETIALELHDTVEIKMPRFGLDDGRNFRVITQQIDCDKRQITFGMWG